MEGLGSRLGRASSRYGQTATVFNGPVRRWKKRWVHVSSSSPSLTYQNPHSQSNNNGNNSRIVLCRWTPIYPANSPAEPAAAPDEPPRRKFRYTPVSVVEEQKKGIQKKVGDAEKTNEVDESVTPSDEMHGKPNIDQIMKEQDENEHVGGGIGRRLVSLAPCEDETTLGTNTISKYDTVSKQCEDEDNVIVLSASSNQGQDIFGCSCCSGENVKKFSMQQVIDPMMSALQELDENQSGLQDSNRSHLDLDLGLKGHSSNLELMAQMKKGSSERFWLD